MRSARRSRRERSRPEPAITSCASGRTCAIASMSTSKPFRGTSRLVPSTNGRSGSSPIAARTATRSSSEIGWKRSTSTPGGMITPGSGRRAAAHRLACGIAPGRDDARGRVQPARAELARPGQPPGHRHLGTVHDHEVRRGAQARPERAERQPRIEEDHVGRDLARERIDAVAPARASGAAPAPSCARCGTAARRPIPARPGTGW